MLALCAGGEDAKAQSCPVERQRQDQAQPHMRRLKPKDPYTKTAKLEYLRCLDNNYAGAS